MRRKASYRRLVADLCRFDTEYDREAHHENSAECDYKQALEIHDSTTAAEDVITVTPVYGGAGSRAKDIYVVYVRTKSRKQCAACVGFSLGRK